MLPDAHADFVFAVAGEEFGLIVCLVIVGVFAFIVLRGLLRAAAGAATCSSCWPCTGLVDRASACRRSSTWPRTLHLIPTKGMTLPFISYGGSSVIAVALGMGMLLALTRRRGPGDLL